MKKIAKLVLVVLSWQTTNITAGSRCKRRNMSHREHKHCLTQYSAANCKRMEVCGGKYVWKQNAVGDRVKLTEAVLSAIPQKNLGSLTKAKKTTIKLPKNDAKKIYTATPTSEQLKGETVSILLVSTSLSESKFISTADIRAAKSKNPNAEATVKIYRKLGNEQLWAEVANTVYETNLKKAEPIHFNLSPNGVVSWTDFSSGKTKGKKHMINLGQRFL